MCISKILTREDVLSDEDLHGEAIELGMEDNITFLSKLEVSLLVGVQMPSNPYNGSGTAFGALVLI